MVSGKITPARHLKPVLKTHITKTLLINWSLWIIFCVCKWKLKCCKWLPLFLTWAKQFGNEKILILVSGRHYSAGRPHCLIWHCISPFVLRPIKVSRRKAKWASGNYMQFIEKKFHPLIIHRDSGLVHCRTLPHFILPFVCPLINLIPQREEQIINY